MVNKLEKRMKCVKTPSKRNEDILMGIKGILLDAVEENDDLLKKRECLMKATVTGDKSEVRKCKNNLNIQNSNVKKRLLSVNHATIGQYYSPGCGMNQVYERKK